MINSLRWVECYLSRVIDLSIIEEFEYKYDIQFPEKYIEIIRKYNTAYPEVKSEEGQWQDGVIRINNKKYKILFIEFQNSIEGDSLIETDIFGLTKKVSNCLEAKLIPFARSNDHLFYFDYRENRFNPSIVFHKYAYKQINKYFRGIITKSKLENRRFIFKIANCFEDFLAKIEAAGNFRWGAIENEVDLNLIKRFEQLKNIKFPKEYIDVMKSYNGGDPEFLDYWGRWQSAVIDIGNNTYRTICLLGFRKNKLNIMDMFEANEEVDKIKLITFALDSAACEYYFDFDYDMYNPPIIYYAQEAKPGKRYKKIADSFKELVSNFEIENFDVSICNKYIDIEQDKEFIKKMSEDNKYLIN